MQEHSPSEWLPFDVLSYAIHQELFASRLAFP
jgi:hypothetical protein